MPMDVLLTGAFGRVGTALIDHLADEDQYRFTYLEREPHPEFDAVVADVADEGAIRPAFDGQDAVVHLAGNPSPGASWPEILSANVIGTYNVLSAARDAGVDQIVFASTNHVVGGYRIEREPELYDGEPDLEVDHVDPPRPDSYYAVSKLLGEHLGRYLVEIEDTFEQFYALRIGWVLDPEWDSPYGPPERRVEAGEIERGTPEYRRAVNHCKAHWCSRRDMARLVDLALQDESVGFDIFYARSASDHSWFSIDHARDVLGFEPLDDAEAYERPF
ncbi:NAD-dependent epimerase/dehydratase family protein [Halosimplex sp. J119]